VVCAACAATGPAGNRIYHSSGTRLETRFRTAEPDTRPAAAAERKQASVLFADVVESMMLA
jgi:hypothetical protein